MLMQEHFPLRYFYLRLAESMGMRARPDLEMVIIGLLTLFNCAIIPLFIN